MMARIKGASPVIIIAGIVLIVIASAVLFITTRFQSTIPLYLGTGVFNATVAYTKDARDKGYGGVTSIASNQALILAYPSDGKWPIWMKDMVVPIDIVWVSSDNKVVYITKNASPAGGSSTVFVPTTSARYVVELAAGAVESDAITIGRSAIVDINQQDIQP